MSKGNPYPLRLEADEEKEIGEIKKATGLPQALIMRLALRAGLGAVDWKLYRKPQLHSEPTGHLEMSDVAFNEVNSSPGQAAAGQILAAGVAHARAATSAPRIRAKPVKYKIPRPPKKRPAP